MFSYSVFGKLVRIEGNRLSGSVPDGFCAKHHIDWINGARVDEVAADCSQPDEGLIAVDCDCCSHCCSSQDLGLACLPTFIGA